MANKYPLVLSGASIQEIQTGDALATTSITAGTSSTAGTLEGNWTLTAGSKLQSTYADLAEKYESDWTYDEGTVVVFGGEKEITLTESVADTRVAGVISQYPAYVMNSASTGQTVALRGRVPVKVIGQVKKGDLLVTSSLKGHAEVISVNASPNAVFAKSLEDKHTVEPGIINAVIL